MVMELTAFVAGAGTGIAGCAGAGLTGAMSAAGALWTNKKTAAVTSGNTGMRRDMMKVNVTEKRKVARTR